MCVMSMVYDEFAKRIPPNWPGLPYVPSPGAAPMVPHTVTPLPLPTLATKADIDALRTEVAQLCQVVADFKEAVKAAAVVDRLTRQPDCVDPSKKSLDDRVADLERRLDAATRALGASP